MVAELDDETALWTVGSVGQRLEDYSAVIATKPPSECGAEAVVDWMQWSGVPILARDPAAVRMPGRLTGESLNRLRKPTFRLDLQSQEQSQEQHIRLDEDQLTTDTADLKTKEEALAEDTAAFEDITQDCLVCQTKFVEFKAYNKSLSGGLETLAKAKAVIYEKTGDVEHQNEDGWVFGVETHESAISDQFVGATEVSNHGKPGTRVEMMVDSGSTATVCGLKYFCDTLVTIGPPMRLRASNGQPLKHYGQKKVELFSDGGEKMYVTFSVHDVKRAMTSTSATAPCGIETHLDEWNPQEGRTVSYFKKRTSGGTRWLNMMTRGGLYFLGATVANGQLQQPGAYPKSCGHEYNLTFPTWRTSGDVAPMDGDEEMAPAEEAAGAAPVDVAADADPANNQSPEADGWSNDNVSLAPTDPKGPPMSVGQWAQQNEPTEAEKIAQVGATKATRAWTRRLRAWTWPDCVRRCGRDDPHRRQDLEEGNPMPIVQCDYFFFKAEKEDILCKAISAIDSVYNRTMALECEFKGLSDQAVPKQLREYLKSLGFKRAQVQGDPEGALNNVLDRAIHGLPGWTRRQSPLKDKQTSTRTCGTLPCNPGMADAHLAQFFEQRSGSRRGSQQHDESWRDGTPIPCDS